MTKGIPHRISIFSTIYSVSVGFIPAFLRNALGSERSEGEPNEEAIRYYCNFSYACTIGYLSASNSSHELLIPAIHSSHGSQSK